MVLSNFGTLGCSSLQSRRARDQSNPQRIERVSQIATAVVVILQTSAVKSVRFAQMVELKRWSTTILVAAPIWSAQPARAAAMPQQSPQLVITSATFDASNGRLVIAGQNFLAARGHEGGREGRGHASAPPVVTLD